MVIDMRGGGCQVSIPPTPQTLSDPTEQLFCKNVNQNTNLSNVQSNKLHNKEKSDSNEFEWDYKVTGYPVQPFFWVSLIKSLLYGLSFSHG